MPRPTRAKPPVPAWIIRERKRLDIKPRDIAERLTAMGLPVTEGTVRTWEAGRSPHPDNVEGLERIFGSAAPGNEDAPADQTAVVAAIDRQTAALSALVDELQRWRTEDRVRLDQVEAMLDQVVAGSLGAPSTRVEHEPPVPDGAAH